MAPKPIYKHLIDLEDVTLEMQKNNIKPVRFYITTKNNPLDIRYIKQKVMIQFSMLKTPDQD